MIQEMIFSAFKKISSGVGRLKGFVFLTLFGVVFLINATIVFAQPCLECPKSNPSCVGNQGCSGQLGGMSRTLRTSTVPSSLLSRLFGVPTHVMLAVAQLTPAVTYVASTLQNQNASTPCNTQSQSKYQIGSICPINNDAECNKVIDAYRACVPFINCSQEEYFARLKCLFEWQKNAGECRKTAGYDNAFSSNGVCAKKDPECR